MAHDMYGGPNPARKTASRVKYYRYVPVLIMPLGTYRSLPAEVTSTVPSIPVRPPKPLTHPQDRSKTAPDGTFASMEPANESTLATGCPPGFLSEDPEE
jgi:hypothetical protein